jgi:hypothetical protein
MRILRHAWKKVDGENLGSFLKVTDPLEILKNLGMEK